MLTGFSRRSRAIRLGRHVGQRLARADGGAHRPLPDRRAVVAHVAFHHLLVFGSLRNAERAGQHAVRAGDAARLERRLHDAVLALLDRVRRADLRRRSDRRSASRSPARWRWCRARSTKSKLIIDTPRCVSHSSQALRQAWQPMQRDGIDVELEAEHPPPPERSDSARFATGTRRPLAPGRLLDPAGRDLELRDLAARIERAVRQPVGALRRRASGRE